ncbi:MAG: tetraacyldisaccharide 4'-kinase [Granulosicoccus sp.]
MLNTDIHWQRRTLVSILLWPVSCLYGAIVSIRRALYTSGLKPIHQSPLPVIVVGNLSVGGTGKTPLCAHLVGTLNELGWQPAIVSRGYGGKPHQLPHIVDASDRPETVGDEPLMLFQQTRVPVCVCVDRAAAVSHLAANTAADIIVSDDGLQHLAMSRNLQILVVDAQRGFGNRWLLPAGPMRDFPGRVQQADLVVLQLRFSSDPLRHDSLTGSVFDGDTLQQTSTTFHLQPGMAVKLKNAESCPLSDFADCPVHAVAGIGNPARFFHALERTGIKVNQHPMPDHHAYSPDDFLFADALPILVTSKDAVKLRCLDALPEHIGDRIYEVTTDVILSDELERKLAHLGQTALRALST